MTKPFFTVRRLALALPVIFVVHVCEEAPGFVAWFNGLVSPHVTQQLFLTVNLVAFMMTLLVSGIVAASDESVSALVGVAWVGFLMLANGVFHVIGTVAHGRYCPGVITAALLYLPVSGLFLWTVAKERKLSPLLVTVVALLGGIPMYIHGYLIVFRGSRLF
jgi:hypothetical protein